jgi:hypothetical protein
MLRPFVDRRIRHNERAIDALVRKVFTEGSSTYAEVFVPAWGSILPYVKAPANVQAGQRGLLFKQGGLWTFTLP